MALKLDAARAYLPGLDLQVRLWIAGQDIVLGQIEKRCRTEASYRWRR